MATLVCRGLHSCLEPHLVQEPAMTVLTLKLLSPPNPFTHALIHEMASSSPPLCQSLNTPPQQQLLEDPKHAHTHTHTHHHHQHHPISSSSASNPNMGRALGGWSFLHALSTTNTSCQEPSRPDPEPPVYVHPLARASAFRLSPLSLELCTENLGSESSNIVAFDDGGDGDPRDASESAKGEQTAPRPWSTRQIMSMENASRKAIPRTNINNSSGNSNSFPPPLTTIANDSIRVRPHREEGRLILEAVRDPQGNRPCFRAERSHGRLRLCFFKDRSPLCFDSEEPDDEGENDVEARTDGAENDVAVEGEEEEAEELSLVDGRGEEGEAEAEHDSDGGDGEEEEAMDGTHEEEVGGNLRIGMLDHHPHYHHHQQRNGHEISEKKFIRVPPLVASS